MTDSAGSIVYCTRCGRQRHPRPPPADIHHQGHANLGYKVTLRDEPGAALHIVLLLTDVNGNQEFCLVRFVLSERMFRL